MGFRRSAEFGLYPPRLSSEWPACLQPGLQPIGLPTKGMSCWEHCRERGGKGENLERDPPSGMIDAHIRLEEISASGS